MSPGRLRPVSAVVAVLVAVALAACGPREDQVSVAGRDFTVEVRDTEQGRAQGLSGRAEVPKGTGMLFLYDDAAARSYWMAGMLVPIDLAWISDGRVVGIETLQPCQPEAPCPQHPSPGPVDAVLEVAAGQLAGVESGEPVIIELR